MMAAMPRLSIDAIAKHVILHSSSGVVFDQVGFTKFDVAKEEAPGGEARRPPDAQASLVVSMPPDNVFSRSTLDGAAVLDMSGDELQRFAGGKVIVVCNDHDTTKHDVHHYPDGRHFSGGQVHAAALDALLSGRIISTPPWWYFLGLTIDSRIVWECLLAAVGAILGAYVARLPRHRLGNGIVMVSLSAIVIGACILSYHLAGVLYSPLVPALAATIAFELAYVTWRSTTRNVV
jgi:hypothetical protein